MIDLAADGTARAIAPDGTPRGPARADAAGVEDSKFVPWSRWRNGGRGDMACERGDIGDLRESAFEVFAGVQAPPSAFAAVSCSDPSGESNGGGFALSDGSRIAVFAIDETSVTSWPRPRDEARVPDEAPVLDEVPGPIPALTDETVEAVRGAGRDTEGVAGAPPEAAVGPG